MTQQGLTEPLHPEPLNLELLNLELLNLETLNLKTLNLKTLNLKILNGETLNCETLNGVGARRTFRCLTNEAGAATAEYVVATMAAVGFAGVLIVILRSAEVRGILTDLVRSALSVG